MKTLYFEGAGSATPETVAAGVGNCRIRTAFHTPDGKRVYLEIIAGRRNVGTGKNARSELVGWVDFAHWITGDREDCNNRIIRGVERTGEPIPYTPEGILSVVRKCGGDFDAVRVLPRLSGYCVHRDDRTGYNYADEFDFDEAATNKREDIERECERLEIEARRASAERHDRVWSYNGGSIWPNCSVWVPEDRPRVLCWELHDGPFCGLHEIYLDAGDVAACIKSATGWTDETFGDFSKAVEQLPPPHSSTGARWAFGRSPAWMTERASGSSPEARLTRRSMSSTGTGGNHEYHER